MLHNVLAWRPNWNHSKSAWKDHMSGCLYAAAYLLQITYTSDVKDLDFSYVYFLLLISYLGGY